jgi:hypothetical protein
MACATAEGVRSLKRGRLRGVPRNANSTSRAGSPLLFGLAPRGVFRASCVATRAVGSYPTFSPLPNDAREDVSQVYLRDATVQLRRRYILCGTFRERTGWRRFDSALLKPLP